MQLPFQLLVKGKEVLGVAHIPLQHKDDICVYILCYGLNGHRVDEHRMGYKLGIIGESTNNPVFRFDYRNAGVSAGSFEDSSLKDREEDVLRVIAFVKSCYPNSKISLVGYSDGAKVAAAVAEKSKDVTALVLWNPIMAVPDNDSDCEPVSSTNTTKFVLHPVSKKPVASIYGLWFGTKLLTELKNDTTYSKLASATYPLLCVFGEKDLHTQNIREAIISDSQFMAHTEICIIPEAGHTFNGYEQDLHVIEKTLRWQNE